MPNKRTSQLTDFMSYQLSMDASVGRNLPLTLSQPIMTQVWGTRTLQECLYSVLYTRQQSGKGHCMLMEVTHCRLMGESNDSSCTYNYQRALSVPDHELQSSGQCNPGYCWQFLLWRTRMHDIQLHPQFHLCHSSCPFSRYVQPCYFFTQNSH